MREPSTTDDNKALVRANEFISVLNQGSPDDIRHAVARMFAATATISFESAPPGDSDGSGAWAVQLARLVGGIAVASTESTAGFRTRLHVNERHPLASGRAEIDCRVELLRPHLISEWSYRPLDVVDRPHGRGVDGRAIDAVLDDLTDAGLFSGVVLLETRNGRFQAARGPADRAHGEPNHPGTRFNIASITKLATAVGVCRLVEQGIIDLQAPIAVWLGDDVDRAIGRLTALQLLLHVTGLPEQMPEVDLAGHAEDDWLAPIRGIALEFEPGSRWQYSNVGYALLGAVIERALGTPYFEAMASLVFRPAGMSATGFEDSATLIPGRAVGYLYSSDDALRPTIPNVDAGLGRGAPYGYATSSAEDIDRLILAIAEHRIVGPLMADRILAGSGATDTSGRTVGYGSFRDRVGERYVTSFAGAGPGISAWVDAVPELGYRAVVLSNYPKPAAHRVGRYLRSRFLAGALS